MSRVALTKTKLIAAVAVLIIVGGGGVYITQHDDSKQKSTTGSFQKAETTEVSYKGEDGKDALTLLKTHAQVVTKSSSLGDYVTSINGNDGGGSKYWIFYVNNTESQVGAGAYITKSTDNIQWKLQ